MMILNPVLGSTLTDNHTSSLGTSHTPTEKSPVSVIVLAGPDAGLTQELREGTMLVGSHPDCQLRLTDPAISRRHLSLELRGNRVRAIDMGSKNGTVYLGAKVMSVDVPLGANLELGGTTLAVVPLLGGGVLSERTQVGGLLGRSVSMRRLFARIEQVAPTEATCLVTGETGTGKSLVARALHDLSTRAKAPFVTLDCGTLTDALAQSVLFGHVRGAFTGAVKDTIGLVGAAAGGTLFLDEVASLPLELQPILLRLLEARSYQRVGDATPRDADIRIIASTTSDLVALSKQGKFRIDLYYRLAAITLEVPTLKDRLDDVAMLAQHFAERAGATEKLPPAALSTLTGLRWPGNVRELKSTVERAIALGETLMPGSPPSGQAEDFHIAREKTLHAFERSYLEALLERHQGSTSAVQKEANLGRSYLYRLLDAHGLSPSEFRKRNRRS